MGFFKTDVTPPQNIQSKEQVVFALNRWTLLLAHGETLWKQGTRGRRELSRGGRSVWSRDEESGCSAGGGKVKGG